MCSVRASTWANCPSAAALSLVDALTEHIARHGELRIGTEVLGYGEQVVGLDPELQALQEG